MKIKIILVTFCTVVYRFFLSWMFFMVTSIFKKFVLNGLQNSILLYLTFYASLTCNLVGIVHPKINILSLLFLSHMSFF